MIVILIIVMSCTVTVSASEDGLRGDIKTEKGNVSTCRTGSITVNMNENRKGISFKCSKVAYEDDGEFYPEKEYKRSGVDFNNLRYSYEIEKAIGRLLRYESESEKTRCTDQYGKAVFENLEPRSLSDLFR